jgi:hypothetical protein
MKHAVITTDEAGEALDVQTILGRVASVSARPRYTMLVLDLLARACGDNGRAGPWIQEGETAVPVREWLCGALDPFAARSARRQVLAEHVRAALAASGRLPVDPAEADDAVDAEVRERVRVSGMTAVSRAVTELVKAGLVTRHYQGYAVDHENRGAQRTAVYTVPEAIRAALGMKTALL